MEWVKYTLASLVLLLALSLPLSFQGLTGAIEGVVSDEFDAPIPGVYIEADNQVHGRTFRSISQATGLRDIRLVKEETTDLISKRR